MMEGTHHGRGRMRLVSVSMEKGLGMEKSNVSNTSMIDAGN